MSRLHLAIVAVVALALLIPSAASAADTYYISKGQAERNVRDAAAYKYGDGYGIRYRRTGASCRPQFYDRAERGYVYHRWVCTWAGEDYDGDTAYGVMRIVGHSGNTYGYKVVRGIFWD